MSEKDREPFVPLIVKVKKIYALGNPRFEKQTRFVGQIYYHAR